MKLFLPAVSVLLALHYAEAAGVETRVLRRQGGGSNGSGGSGGGGGDKAGRLQNMIETECPNFDCSAVANEDSDCTFDKPERPDMTGLTEEQIADLKEDMQAAKQEGRQKMLDCACCQGMSVEDILAAKSEAGESRPFGGGGSGRPGRGDGTGRPSSAALGEGPRAQGLGDGTSTSGSLSGDSISGDSLSGDSLSGDGSSGDADDTGDASSLAQGVTCDMFDCDAIEPEGVNCDLFDSANGNVRGRRRRNRLYCRCCRD